jgi:hypothetical protein
VGGDQVSTTDIPGDIINTDNPNSPNNTNTNNPTNTGDAAGPDDAKGRQRTPSYNDCQSCPDRVAREWYCAGHK